MACSSLLETLKGSNTSDLASANMLAISIKLD